MITYSTTTSSYCSTNYFASISSVTTITTMIPEISFFPRRFSPLLLPYLRTSTLEILIEDIQIRHRSDMKSLLDKIHELKNHKGGPPDY
ncbi:hypothetical protein Tco_0219071 [Tanacetum coccineum]